MGESIHTGQVLLNINKFRKHVYIINHDGFAKYKPLVLRGYYTYILQYMIVGLRIELATLFFDHSLLLKIVMQAILDNTSLYPWV